MAVSSEAAISLPQGRMSPTTMDWRPIGRVLSDSDVMNTKANRNSFQALVKANSATERMAGAASGSVISRFDQLPQPVREQLGETGELSVDIFQAPVLVQSWFVLDRIRALAEANGGTMADVFKLVQYFTDLRDYPLYNRVRRLFYPGEPPVSTVVEVSGMLPSREVRIEVEATAFIPQRR